MRGHRNMFATKNRSAARIELPKVTPALLPGNEDPDHELYVDESLRNHYLAALPFARQQVVAGGDWTIRYTANHLIDAEVQERYPLPERERNNRDAYAEAMARQNEYRTQRLSQMLDNEH